MKTKVSTFAGALVRAMVLSLAGLTVQSAAWGADGDAQALALSKTAKLEWSMGAQFVARIFPSEHGFWLTGENRPGDSSVWVSREKPVSMATRMGVSREWKEVLSERARQNMPRNLGCQKLVGLRFACSWIGFERTSKKYLVETYYWNGLDDLVVVQVRGNSRTQTRQLASVVNVRFDKAEK